MACLARDLGIIGSGFNQNRHMKFFRNILIICLVTFGQAAYGLEFSPDIESFIQQMQEKHAYNPDQLREWLEQTERKQSILDAISRPAEAKPWKDYRPIFITEKRIRGGQMFVSHNKELLLKAQEHFGVDARYIAAIIGVETFYGKITGNYRVIDALATLGFYYPRRSKFFKQQLEEFFLMTREQKLNPLELKGSYAGAMGWGQFMPGSYRAYAVDFDNDDKIDMWSNLNDIVGSVANYLAVHKWEKDGPVAEKANTRPGARKLEKLDIKPSYPVEQLTDWGYGSFSAIDPLRLATLVSLEGKNGEEHWLAYQNFYVITRYNRSPLYAMAVHQLAESFPALK